MPNIIYQSPWASDRNIGRAYNEAMSRLKEKEWMCFTDGDAMFLHKWYGLQLEEIVAKYAKSHVGMFTCMTNRVFNPKQLIGGKISSNYDLQYHNQIATQLYNNQKTICTSLSVRYPCSGVLMLVNYDAWVGVKFRELDGLAGVDNGMHKDLVHAKWNVMLMQGVYVFHKYSSDRSHLRK